MSLASTPLGRLAGRIRSGEFAITTELTPPKGLDLTDLLGKAQALREWADAFNLTDSARARMAIAPTAVGRLLIEQGIEPIVQMTARDRNRIAIQADLLGAAALGVSNVVFMAGDKPGSGDHPDAKAVFDLNASEMLAAARGLCAGHDMSGAALEGRPRLYLGATAHPGAPDLASEVVNTRRKIDAGVDFLQTQAVFEPAVLERFLDAVKPDGVAILAGIIPLKSAKSARWLDQNVPGVRVPAEMIRALDAVADTAAEVPTAIELAARAVRAMRPLCAGAHLMAIGWERHLPAILEQAGIGRRMGGPPAAAKMLK